MCTQMPSKVGIERHGEVRVAVMYKELIQLNDGAVEGLNNPVVAPIDPKSITDEEKQCVLNVVNLIKEKKGGTVKGRTCIGGSKQKYYLEEDESITAPTQSLDGFLATCTIDAKEKRHVTTFDVPGAFLQPEMPQMKHSRGKEGKVLMKSNGDIFVDIT